MTVNKIGMHHGERILQQCVCSCVSWEGMVQVMDILFPITTRNPSSLCPDQL